MSDQLREEASWRQGKSPVIGKYVQDHAKLFSAIAGRGFLVLPGYAYDAENGLETAAKQGLSELNYKILAETIEREIKQSGLDYGLAYKTAAIAWEEEKQDLLDAWAKEFASIKANMDHDAEVLNRLKIEVDARGTYLITQKTIIELEAEGYRLQLAEMEGETAAYEVALANAKLATATKKLELIPILQEILVKEEQLLAKEELKSAEYAALIAKNREVADKKNTSLVPRMLALADAYEEYGPELKKQIDAEGLIQDEKILQAGYATEISGQQRDRIETEKSIIDKDMEVQDEKKALSDAKHDTEVSLLTKQGVDTAALSAAEVAANAEILAGERQGHAFVLDKKRTALKTENATKETSSQSVHEGQGGMAINLASGRAQTMIEKAGIEAESQITAKLTHLIG